MTHSQSMVSSTAEVKNTGEVGEVRRLIGQGCMSRMTKNGKKIVHQRLRWVREEGNTIVDNSFGVTTPFSSLQWEIYKF